MVKILLLILLLNISFCTYSAKCSQDEAFEDEIIILQKTRTRVSKVEKLLLKKDMYTVKQFNNLDDKYTFRILKTTGIKKANEAISEFKKTGLFTIVEPNYKLKSDSQINLNSFGKLFPNDKEFKSQYYLDKIKVTNAWLHTFGAPNTIIAILDSGVDYTNLDLNERLLPCQTFVENSFSCQDDYGHGTQITSIVGAKGDNNLGGAGISWLNPILPVKISNENGISTVSTLINGINHAIRSGAKIILISLSTNKHSEALKLVVEEAIEKGILIIASGGNTGVQENRYPAGYKDVIGVGSTGESNEKSSFSTTGSHIKVVAPGENILVPGLSSNTYEFVSGTSTTVPQVGGTLALIWSVNPDLSTSDVREILFSTASDLGGKGYDYKYGYGLIDAQKAVKKALGYTRF